MSLSPNNEEAVVALVEQAKDGDQLAFEKLYRFYSGAIYKHLRYMVADEEIAREILQDTFEKAWKSFHTLHDAASFKNWLYRIATSKAYNHIRRGKLIRWIPWENIDVQVQGNRQEAPHERILLKLALGQVHPKYRQCLILQEIEGFPQHEIAEIVGIGKSSVSQYVKRGYEQLYQAYQDLKSLEKTFLEREYSL
jgi:RNA polymerase sigma-70 factor (ECF subfamily)